MKRAKTNHGWDGGCPVLHLLDAELGLLRRRHQHRPLGAYQRFFHGVHSAEMAKQCITLQILILNKIDYMWSKNMLWRLTSAYQAQLPHPHQHCRWHSSRCQSGALFAFHQDLPFPLSP